LQNMCQRRIQFVNLPIQKQVQGNAVYLAHSLVLPTTADAVCNRAIQFRCRLQFRFRAIQSGSGSFSLAGL
jgi:hypothetical protein